MALSGWEERAEMDRAYRNGASGQGYAPSSDLNGPAREEANRRYKEGRESWDAFMNAGNSGHSTGAGGGIPLILILFALFIAAAIVTAIVMFLEAMLRLTLMLLYLAWHHKLYTILIISLLILLYRAGGHITSKLTGTQKPRLRRLGAIVFVFATLALGAWGYWEAYGRKAEAAKWARLNRLQMEQDSTEARQKRTARQPRRYKVWENW